MSFAVSIIRLPGGTYRVTGRAHGHVVETFEMKATKGQIMAEAAALSERLKLAEFDHALAGEINAAESSL